MIKEDLKSYYLGLEVWNSLGYRKSIHNYAKILQAVITWGQISKGISCNSPSHPNSWIFTINATRDCREGGTRPHKPIISKQQHRCNLSAILFSCINLTYKLTLNVFLLYGKWIILAYEILSRHIIPDAVFISTGIIKMYFFFFLNASINSKQQHRHGR